MEKINTSVYIDMANLSIECRKNNFNIDMELFFNWLKDKNKMVIF